MRTKRITISTSRCADPFSTESDSDLSLVRRAAGLLRGRRLSLVLAASGAALSLAGCAQHPQQPRVTARSKEYFPSSIYGKASPRVIADGQPVPRGGGSYLVGKPYTVAGHTYYPHEKHETQVGLASWYGDAFHGRRTANGEIYDRDAVTAASPTMPLPSYARVTNLRNHYSMVVRVNDRGPFASDRVMDVSRTVAQALDFHRVGTTKVKVEYLAPASLNGSDDNILLATLRQDGRPASLGHETPVMTAQNTEPMRAATEPVAVPRAKPAETPVSAPIAVAPATRAPHAPAKSDSQALAALAAASLTDPAMKPLKPTILVAEVKPLPPSRPFDLRTIPGAGVPISAPRR